MRVCWLVAWCLLLLPGCLQRRSQVAPPLTGLPPHIDSVMTPAPAAPEHAGAPAPTTPAPPPDGTAAIPPQVLEAQQRVKRVNDQLLAANPRLGLKPAFFITDQAEPALQRREYERVFLSWGLVQRCTTDGQLAALLSLQLGELYAQRRAELAADQRLNYREPPPTVPMIREYGSFGNPDQIHLAEIATLGLDQRSRPPEPPANPWLIANEVLLRAGFSEHDLAALPEQMRRWGLAAP